LESSLETLDLVIALINVGLFDKALNLCYATSIAPEVAMRYIAICIANNSIVDMSVDVRESVEPWPHNEELSWRFLRRYVSHNTKLVSCICEGLCIGEYPANLPDWLLDASDDWCTIEVIGQALLKTNRIQEATKLLMRKLVKHVRYS
jgi:hypothetical protein